MARPIREIIRAGAVLAVLTILLAVRPGWAGDPVPGAGIIIEQDDDIIGIRSPSHCTQLGGKPFVKNGKNYCVLSKAQWIKAKAKAEAKRTRNKKTQ